MKKQTKENFCGNHERKFVIQNNSNALKQQKEKENHQQHGSITSVLQSQKRLPQPLQQIEPPSVSLTVPQEQVQGVIVGVLYEKNV
jgi:hypothetical protein